MDLTAIIFVVIAVAWAAYLIPMALKHHETSATRRPIEEFSDGSRYLNFPGFQEEGQAMMRTSFGPQYARLAALKAKYDPTNLFRLNQNIQPNQPI